MTTETTNATTDSTTAEAQAQRTTPKGGSKASKSKAKGRKPSRSARTPQKRPERNRKASGETKQTPYRPGSNYQAIVETLAAYKGKPIDFAMLKRGVKAAMGDGWKAWSEKKGRSKNAMDADAKLHCNVCVLQRKADYAKPLTAMGLELLKTRDEKRGWLYSLVTIRK